MIDRDQYTNALGGACVAAVCLIVVMTGWFAYSVFFEEPGWHCYSDIGAVTCVWQ